MKRVSHSNEGPRMGVALEKFDSSDSNERFRQMFTLEKIKKQVFWVGIFCGMGREITMGEFDWCEFYGWEFSRWEFT